MGIADDQRPVGAAHDDQMHAVADMLALLGEQPLLQRCCQPLLGIAEIADHAEIRHHRAGAVVTFRRSRIMCSLQPCQPVARRCAGLAARGNRCPGDDRPGRRDAAAAGLEPFRGGAVHDALAQKRHPGALWKKRCELRECLARLYADLVRTVQRRGEVGAEQARVMAVDLGRLEQRHSPSISVAMNSSSTVFASGRRAIASSRAAGR